MATKSALPLLALGAGALFVMTRKKEAKPSPTPAPSPMPAPTPGKTCESKKDYRGKLIEFVWDEGLGQCVPTEAFFEKDPRQSAEPSPFPMPGPDDPCPPGQRRVNRGGFWACEPISQPGPTPQPQPEPDLEEERGEALGIKPGTYSNFHTNARYGLVSPYRTPKTTVSLRRKSGMVYYPAKNTEARFAGWNPQNPEELLVDIDAKGEYSIMTHDGGPNGVFIAEWVLKVTED